MRPVAFFRAGAAIAAALILSGCSLLPREADEIPPPLTAPAKSVKVIYTVKKGDIQERVQLRAQFAPRNEATLMFKQGGRLKQRYVDAGQSVTAGQLLAELETGTLHAQVEVAEINLARAQLRLKQAREKAEVYKGTLDPYEEQYLLLDEKVAKVNLETLKAQLAEARLTAPYAGIISDAKANPGDAMAPYQPVVTIEDPRDPVIKAQVEEATALKLQVGQKAQVQFTEFGDKLLEGRLTASPSLNDPAPTPTRPRMVQIDLASPQTGGKLGMVGRAFVILQEKTGVLVLPNSAIRSYAGRTYVVVVEGDSKREVDVVTGIVGETETEITKGLTEGQKVMGR